MVWAEQKLAGWLDYIQKQHTSEMELGLERVRSVAERLNLLQQSARVITVAGTNGKGTTCQALSTCLKEAGFRVGVFSSPHLFDYRERILIHQLKLSYQDHCAAFEQIEQVRGTIPLTYFEYSTLAALWLFAQHALDIIILEVGLGGRLDATNIIDADAVIVTSIALDHCDILGDTREQIAVEKAGVFRPKIPVIYAEENPEQSMLSIASQLECQWMQQGQDYSFNWVSESDTWSYQGPLWSVTDLPKLAIPLANAAAVFALLEVWYPDMDTDVLKTALGKTQVLGRLHMLSHQPNIMVDVAHNPHAARYLAQHIKHNQPKRCLCVLGMLLDKDCAGVIRELSEVVDAWLLVDQSDIARGATALALNQHLYALEQTAPLTFTSVDAALETALAQTTADTLILVTGSFYVVARAMLWDQGRAAKRGNA